MIPAYLYRGDGDRENFRKLHETIHYGQMQTNLINGGNGQRIFELPLELMINTHVSAPGDKSDFLSFSANQRTALRFGIHCALNEVDTKFQDYVECYEHQEKWEFALLTLDTSKLRLKQLDPGVYEGWFPTSLSLYRQYKDYRIILIDVATCLAASPNADNFQYAAENARNDDEWLVLPAMSKIFENGTVQYSGILDGACLSATNLFIKF